MNDDVYKTDKTSLNFNVWGVDFVAILPTGLNKMHIPWANIKFIREEIS